MIEDKFFTVEFNDALTDSVYIMNLCGTPGENSKPGQFVNIDVPGYFLRRPISICDVSEDSLTLVYKVVGGGTDRLSEINPGETLDILTGLGNGFDIEKSGEHPLLLAGGVGAPPLFLLAKRLIAAGKTPTVILGFNTEEDIFFDRAFTDLGCDVYITTVDGSCGLEGVVTDALGVCGEYDYTFACGPLPMLRAVYDKAGVDGQYSFEARMGCGFGVCMGCTIETKNGPKRVCKEGPVFEKGEILW
ncbi:MAG: dihydroorotate dehydrogenase electron transfer subunit [Oscillospiraceae bacterium]